MGSEHSSTTDSTSAAESAAESGTRNRSTTPTSGTFAEYIGRHWAPRREQTPAARAQASFAAARRAALSRAFPERRLVIPAGGLKQRSNDTDYPFRAHSAFAHLTGWGSDAVPDSVLVLEPTGEGHDATLYFRERAGRDSDEFYANPARGEFWIGPRPSLAHVAADLGLATARLDEIDDVWERSAPTLVVREADPALTATLDARRPTPDDEPNDDEPTDATLAQRLSEMRLTKDSYEVGQLREAIAATAAGFDDIVAALPRIRNHRRGERLVEGLFYTRARTEGNAVGYDTISAAGPHACILHWTDNDGPVLDGDLILIDAGVELDSLYTADITRTLPVSGTFSSEQRLVYETVREAADAAFSIVRPGITFRDVHAAAMAVIARRTAEWGLLPVSADEALAADNQHHRRYMVHGTSHHLGIDVHDCAQARREMYHDGIVSEGMVFTIEPGLYFQPDDLTVPEHLRGIGVRIEDNILVTTEGAESLSAQIPRTADEVEAWIARAGRHA